MTVPLGDDAGVTPGEARIDEAFAITAAATDHPRHCPNRRAHPPDANCASWRAELRRRKGWAAAVAEALSVLWVQTDYDAELLARALHVIVAEPALVIRGTNGSRRSRALAVNTAELLVRELARTLGWDDSALPWPQLRQTLHGRGNVDTLHTLISSTLVDIADDTPTVLLLTPLSSVNQDAHDDLMAVASQVQRQLKHLPVRLDVPGARLSPDGDTSWTPQQLYAADRRRVLGADVVFVVAAQHDSWGAAKCITWAETRVPVEVYTTKVEALSRVLGCGPYLTSIQLWDNPAGVASSIIERVTMLLPELRVRAAARVRLQQRARPALGALKSILEALPASVELPTRQRVAMAAGAVGDLLTLELSELATMATYAPQAVDSVLAVVSGLRSPRRQLSAQELRVRDATLARFDATPAERWLVTERATMETPVVADLVGLRRQMTRQDWEQLLLEVRREMGPR